MKRKLVFATNNAHKLEEVSEIVKEHIEILSLKDIGCHEDIDETGETLNENALIKARYVKEKYGYDCFGDDTALEVDALDGAPGIYSARYAGGDHDSEANMTKLLKELENKENRAAQFRTVIALVMDNKEYLFEGKIEGKIIEKRKGNAGFGYDPIFQPNTYTETFAELGNDIKNKISHRALAIEKLCTFLTKL